MTYPWRNTLKFWDSGECQVCMEHLDDLQKSGTLYTPRRRDLFRALSLVKPDDVRCVIMGQDPYPNHRHATGVAFSIPDDVKDFPPTLQNIFKEYQDDLHYPIPQSGNLEKWAERGVLLWNSIPICISGSPLHSQSEWDYLTKELVETLNGRNVVFALLGGVAREFARYVDTTRCSLIETSHPSPRGSLNSRTPFNGSRLFSTINAKLVEQGWEPINWRL